MSDTVATTTDLDRLFKKPLLVAASMDPDDFRPGTLYHYTGAVGLNGILLTSSLRATNFSFLNDPSEVEFGRELVLEILEQQKKQLPDGRVILKRIEKAFVDDKYAVSEVYVFCFTECRDDLSQWRAYGTPAAARYCIGFDLDAIREWAEQVPEVRFEELIYEKRKQVDEIMWLIQKALEIVKTFPSRYDEIADLAASHLARLLPLLKQPDYHAEKEWRVIRWIPTADVSEVCFDAARGVIRPYVVFRLEEPPPVVELLVLAPSRKKTSVKAADMLLRRAGIENVESEHSRIPFAEW